MKLLYTIALIALSNLVMAQGFSSFLSYVNSLPDPANKASAVDSFMTEFGMSGFPYIEVDTANFIYRGPATPVALAGDFNGWNPSNTSLTQLSQTDFWYRSSTFESNARMDYKFVLSGSNWILDPLNPNMVSGGFGPNSELAMPDYIQPWEINEFVPTSKGTLESFNLPSTNTGSTYQIQVYLPAGYDPAGNITYPTAYFQDGQEYISLGGAKNVFDNLIDSALMSATIGIFVRPTDRNNEYAGSKRNTYRQFFISELVPFIDANYRTYADPSRRAVIGASYGGNISALISYNHPDVFGLCGIHSGAFQANGYEAYNLIVNGAVKNIKYASIWGSYESLSANNHDLKDYLLTNSYELWWNELPEGHSWGLWRATTDDILKYLFPIGLTAINTVNYNLNERLNIYPNPSAGKVEFEIPNAKHQDIEIMVRNLDGSIVYSTETNDKKVQLNLSHLSSGIYYVQIEGLVKSYTKLVIQ